MNMPTGAGRRIARRQVGPAADMRAATQRPLAAGSISLRLYPGDHPDPVAVVRELVAQAVQAEQSGFDGIMTSEHHGGMPGYLPNPVQLVGWALEATNTMWAAPCPLLLPLRPVGIVAEETAWLAARFPERVGIGLAAGSLLDDFEIAQTTKETAAAGFPDQLSVLAALLSGRFTEASGPVVERLRGDRAIQRCVEHPIPLVSAAMSPTAARRAAKCGLGLLFDSLTSTGRVRQLVEAYREAGGSGPMVLIRRAWVGTAPEQEFGHQIGVYRGYAAPAAQTHWGNDEMVTGADARSAAQAIAGAVRASGANAVNIRLHVPGLAAELIRSQIQIMADVVPHLRAALQGGQF